MSTAIAPPLNQVPQAKTQLTNLVRSLLARVYLDGIDRVLSVEVQPNNDIIGYFQDGAKFLEYTISSNGEISYKLAPRRDSWIEGYLLSLPEMRSDARKSKPTCKVGISCGAACISAHRTCRVKAKHIATPQELHQLRLTAAEVRSPAPTPASTIPADDLDNKSIRELKKTAAEQNVYRYSYMTSEQLKNTLRTLKDDPDHQERLRKTLEKRQERQKAITSFAPARLVKNWKTLQKISRISGTSPETVALFAAASLMGVSVAVAQRARDHYQSELPESAKMAIQRAPRIPVDKVRSPNIIFAVGGFSGIGSTGQRMKEMLETPQDNTKGEKWFGRDNYIIPFNHKEFDIAQPSVSKRNADGSYNPAYLGYVAQAGFGKTLQNLRRGRNEAAVDLAAQIYAYGATYKKTNINLLGHSAGGNTVREAVEILSKMRPPNDKGMSGFDVLKRVNVVNLGTPYFGFTNSKVWNSVSNRTLTSSQDPFSILPKKMPQWISTVKGHEIGNYLGDGEVRDRLREAFGYYNSSILGQSQSRERRKAVTGAIGEALTTSFPPAGRLWNQLIKIPDKAGDNHTAAAIYSGALLAGTGIAAYGYQKTRHRNAIAGYADQAKRMSDDLTVPHIRNSSIMFTVGGAGATSSEIASLVKNNPSLHSKNHVIPFDDDEYKSAGTTSGDSNNPDYLGSLANQEYGRAVRSVLQNKNPAAIRLAAQLHAYTSSKFQQNQVNPKYLPINVLAYGGGGIIAREAMEIVRAMPDGRQLSEHIRLATVSTPSFGLVKDDVREKSFISSNDPFRVLPQRNNGAGSTVVVDSPSRTAKDYLSNPTVIKGISDTFNEKRSFIGKGRVIAEKNNIAEPKKSHKELISKLPSWMSIEKTGDDDPRKNPGWESLSESEAVIQLTKYMKVVANRRRASRQQAAIASEVKQSRRKTPTF